MSNKKYHFETIAIHAGQKPDPATLARAVPVYRTTAYNFRNSKHGADLFALKEPGNIYARLMNPTNDVLEQRIAALDGGAAALTFASGTAAIYFALTNIAKLGDEIVSANNLYGGTFTQFDAILPQQGITVRFTNVNDFDAVEKAINEHTRAIYNVTGMYRAIWNRQEGKCYYCGRPFLRDQQKMLTVINNDAVGKVHKYGYVHRRCMDISVDLVETDTLPYSTADVMSLLEHLQGATRPQGQKFLPLSE